MPQHAAGNLTDDQWNYENVYDAWNRLRKVNNQSAALVAEFTYNGLGHRVGWHYNVDGDATVEDTSDDPWFYFVYDDRWVLTATYRSSDSAPKEEFVQHNAGLDGTGGSSYIDAVVLRNRDANTAWASQADGTLEERRYYCQNWRADVSAILTDTGKMAEWVKYSAYGVPFGLPAGDTDSDGDWDATDAGAITGAYDVRKDADLNGAIDGTVDVNHANSIVNGYQPLGRNVMTSTGVKSRKGYAGYEHDPSLWGTADKGRTFWHVRHRVLDSGLGRWVQRDPQHDVALHSLNGYLSLAVFLNALRDDDSPNAMEDTLTMRCRNLWVGVHCWVVCCRPNGECHSYSLLPEAGRACIVRDKEWCPGCPGFDSPSRKDPGLQFKRKRGAGLCDCAEITFQLNEGCNYDYNMTTCNSNWFAGSMWQCCTGKRGIGPLGAHFYQRWDCCRDDVKFFCPGKHGFGCFRCLCED